jgi:hypothetical protein
MAWGTHPDRHSALVWLQAGEVASVGPILPANGPILRALALPPHYALTNAEGHGVEPELARLGKALSSGLRLIQVRDKTLPPAQRDAFAHAVVALTGGYDHAVVLINDDQDLARAVGAQGLHLSSSRLWQIDRGRISSGLLPRATRLPICCGQLNSGWTLSCSARCCQRPAIPPRPAWDGQRSRVWWSVRRCRSMRSVGWRRRCSKRPGAAARTALR